MATSFLHGFEFIETAIYHPIEMVRSSVIGLVGTAPKGPINSPTLITRRVDAVANFGDLEDGYTIPHALKAIFDQGDFIGFVVVVNVFDPTVHKSSVSGVSKTFGADNKLKLDHRWVMNEVVTSEDGLTTYVRGTDYSIDYVSGVMTRLTGGAIPSGATVKVSYDYQDPALVVSGDIIGGVDAQGNKKGIEALLDVSSIYGFAPKILIAPVFSKEKQVMDALLTKADTLRAVAIADPQEGWTVEQVIQYRGQFDSPRAIICYPNVYYYDPIQGVEKLGPLSPYLAGVMSRTDNTLGWWYSPSNKVIYGVTKLERPIPYISFSSPNSLANYLNENHIVTVINFEGFRVWGNRSATTDSSWKFISVRREFDMIEDSVEIGTLHLLDRPINRAFFEDLTDSVQAFLNSLVGRGAIIAGKVKVLPEDNPPEQIANGHVTARIDITPTYPAERITYNVTLSIEELRQLFQ